MYAQQHLLSRLLAHACNVLSVCTAEDTELCIDAIGSMLTTYGITHAILF